MGYDAPEEHPILATGQIAKQQQSGGMHRKRFQFRDLNSAAFLWSRMLFDGLAPEAVIR